MSDSAFNSQLPAQLEQLLQSGTCVAYLGSGLSASVFPDWPDLVSKLCSACECETAVNGKSSASELLLAADDARTANSDRYHQCLSETFRTFAITNPLYRLLLRTPFKSYITSNFDPLLAYEARDESFGCKHVLVYPNLNREYIDKRAVFYLHGLIDEDTPPTATSIVLTHSDFTRAYEPNSPITNFLIETFKYDPICFVGCSLREPSLEAVFRICGQQRDALRRAGGGSPPPRYILRPTELLTVAPQADLEAARAQRTLEEEEFYRGYDIRVVRYDQKDGHVGLRALFEQVTKLPRVPMNRGFAPESLNDQ